MIIKPNIVEAVNSLISSKQRTILALIGIFVGIGSVIAMVSVGTIVEDEALRQFMDLGTDVVTLVAVESSRTGRTARPLTPAIAMDIPKNCPAIRRLAPYSSTYGNLKFQAKKINITAFGVTADYLSVNRLNLASGRFIHELDHDMFYCVIGYEVANYLRKQGVSTIVGTQILFKEKYITIIGELKSMPTGGMRPYETNKAIMVPISTMYRIDEKARINNAIGRIIKGATQPIIEQQVNAYLKQENRGKMEARTAQELVDQMEKQMRLFTLLLGVIGSISLIVGGIGVMNVMLVSVSERTREIGIRRALGAKRGDIMLQFLIESILLCIVGGLLGIALGVGVSWVISFYAKWHFTVSWFSVGLGVVVAVVVGVFFGIYPARQAARMSPILALRSE